MPETTDMPLPTLRLAIIGPPACGKGTIARWIARDFDHVSLISTGDLLRKRENDNTELGSFLRNMFKTGGMLDDDRMMTILMEELKSLPHQRWCIDGFPRRPAQCVLLDKYLGVEDQLDLVIALDVPESVLRERVAGRWVHPASGRIYGMGNVGAPQVHGIDDITGEPLVQRSDDKSNCMDTRMKNYHEHIAEICAYYEKSGRLLKLVGDNSPVFYEAIKKHLEDRIIGPKLQKILTN